MSLAKPNILFRAVKFDLKLFAVISLLSENKPCPSHSSELNLRPIKLAEKMLIIWYI